MHLPMILMVLTIAWAIRQGYGEPHGDWSERWQRALLAFGLPPLLILTTAIALICMGGRGQMMGLPAGGTGLAIASLFCLYGAYLSLKLVIEGFTALQKISGYQQQQLAGQSIHVMESTHIFAAQVGFWQPKLVVSSGLLQGFDAAHITAVLKHEQAHVFYRDTFWFFGLGCLRQITHWLPHTDLLWQELLLLRELRADRWAAQQVEALVLAESLLWSVSHVHGDQVNLLPNLWTAALSNHVSRLEQRIEMLLTDSSPNSEHHWHLAWLGLGVLPLVSIFMHS